MTFDQEKHHRRSLRLKNRDYSREGYYFVTICARNRENIFADFCVGVGLAPTLVLTAAGRIVENNWRKIADQNVKTDAFVIMPNHIHGIIIIKSHCLRVGVGLAPTPDLSPTSNSGQPPGLPLPQEMALAPDSPPDNDHGRPQGAPLQQKIAPPSTLGAIIGAFKSRCALEYLKFIDGNDLNESGKIWQRNYYEHIIRDRKELAVIKNYIKSNPNNWTEDEENPLNL